MPENMVDQIKKIAEELFEALGNGQSESVYDTAFGVGLRSAGIPYESQKIVPVTYKGTYVGYLQPDYVVAGAVVELKTAVSITDGFRSQLEKYMRQMKLKTGIIINFPYSGSRVEIEVTTPPPSPWATPEAADKFAKEMAMRYPGKSFMLSDGTMVTWTSDLTDNADVVK